MSEPEKKDDEDKKPDAAKMAAFSDRRDDLFDALDMLYIYGNASGRNKFREKWPDVAAYIFDKQLIKFDDDGVDDIDLRKKLEEEADARRFFLKETIEEMVEKSVDSGVLKFDYVGKVVDAFGPVLSTYLYSETVIDRVRPGVLNKEESLASPDDGLSETEKQALTPKDDLIDVGDASLGDVAVDDLVPPEDEQDDMTEAKGIDEDVADELFPDDEQADVDSSQAKGVEQNEQQVSDVNEVPPPSAPIEEETKSGMNSGLDHENVANPAPDVGAPLAPPSSEEKTPQQVAMPSADEKVEQQSSKVEPVSVKEKSPEAALLDAVRSVDEPSLTAPEVEPTSTVPEAEPLPSAPQIDPQPNAPEAEPLPAAPEIEPMPTTPEAESMPSTPAVEPQPSLPEAEPLPYGPEVEPPSDLSKELLEEAQPQLDEASPQQEGHQAEGSQSPEQLEDMKTEQSKESKVDSVSFAGRE